MGSNKFLANEKYGSNLQSLFGRGQRLSIYRIDVSFPVDGTEVGKKEGKSVQRTH